MNDPLAVFWRNPIGVRRLSGSGNRGDVYTPALSADPEVVTGMWEDGNRQSVDQGGITVTSTARFAYPITVDPIPVRSYVIAPDGTRRTVVSSQSAQLPGLGTPDHHVIEVT